MSNSTAALCSRTWNINFWQASLVVVSHANMCYTRVSRCVIFVLSCLSLQLRQGQSKALTSSSSLTVIQHHQQNLYNIYSGTLTVASIHPADKLKSMTCPATPRIPSNQ